MRVLFAILATATVASSFLSRQNCGKDVATSLKMAYIPDGMSPEQWRKVQEKENATKAKKKFGVYGPQSFKSRSLQSFQKDLDKGKAGHLLPVFNAKEQVKQGKIKPEDIPYMQRGGSWDNSDLPTAKKRKWNESDKTYDAIEGPVKAPDWLGNVQRRGPSPKAPSSKASKEAPKATKKRFGLF